jgi:hypothetical protein
MTVLAAHKDVIDSFENDGASSDPYLLRKCRYLKVTETKISAVDRVKMLRILSS